MVSKVKENNVKDVEVTEVKDDKVDPKEAIETLRVQLQDHLKQSEYHKTMALKAQGALEVLLQLHPEEEKSES